VDLRRAVKAGSILVVLLGVPAVADDLALSDREAACGQLLQARGQALVKHNCRKVATLIYDKVRSAVVAKSLPMDAVEPKPTETVGGQGSPAQTAAVPSVAPTSQAGGTVAFAGTAAGPRLVSALSLNPLSLGADNAKSFAWSSRTTDISIVVPVATSGTPSLSGIDFVGVRLRVNALGPAAGSAAYNAALAAYEGVAQQSTDLAGDIEAALGKASDIARCAAAIEASDLAAESVSCGGQIATGSSVAAQADFQAKIATARAEADRQYLGLDLRGDFGDPTFSGNPGARGATVLAALGAGKRFGSERKSLTLRGRAGAAYSYLSQSHDTAYSIDWGVGAELGTTFGAQPGRGSVGLEGRQSKTSGTPADTNFVDLKVGVAVPLTNGTAVSVGISIPLQGGHTSQLTVAGDWSLLLPKIGAGNQ
jgi:hypothetical protein